MDFDFDEIVSREATHCVKWEFELEDRRLVYRDPGSESQGAYAYLPMWVADMDFKCAQVIIDALIERARQGIFGYTSPAASYFDAVIGWTQRRHGWKIDKDWITITPGVVPALKYLVQAFIEPGDKVLIQPPVYHPFSWAIERNGGVVATNPLIYENGRYRMDFEDLARQAADPALKMAFLCSPHNPVGRVWRPDELSRFAEICLENNVLVVSDEVHCDLVYKNIKFAPYATSCEEPHFQNSVICRAASKSFNLAGMRISCIIIPDEGRREHFQETILKSDDFNTNPFSLAATEAAFNHGGPWLDAAMDYVEGNLKYMEAYFETHLPEFKVVRPEGTYLVWVDFNALEMTPEARKKMFLEEACLGLDEGEIFGEGGQGFERFNIACPRATLEDALNRIRNVVGPRLSHA